MQRESKLVPFVLVLNRKVISSYYITTREYGRWGTEFFDETTALQEFFKKESKDGIPTQVSHPGSRIGVFFRESTFSGDLMRSAYFRPDSKVAEDLYKRKLALPADVNYICPEGKEQLEKWLRCYTPDQVQLYIRSNIDRNFKIADKLTAPLQIRVAESDLKKIYIPEVKQKKSLF